MQKATELVNIRQEKVFDPLAEKRVTVEVPNLVTTTATADVEIADGGLLLLLPVKYRPPGAKKKDKVRVLLLRPTIIIDEEERARRNNSK